ncbi:MAG: hypothetical protein ACOY94_25765 [Bacillota bacterium]
MTSDLILKMWIALMLVVAIIALNNATLAERIFLWAALIFSRLENSVSKR